MNRVRRQDRRSAGFDAPCGFIVERRKRPERRRIEVTESSMEEFESLIAAMNARRAEIIEQTIADWDLALRGDNK